MCAGHSRIEEGNPPPRILPSILEEPSAPALLLLPPGHDEVLRPRGPSPRCLRCKLQTERTSQVLAPAPHDSAPRSVMLVLRTQVTAHAQKAPEVSSCAADSNDDGVIDVRGLLALLASYESTCTIDASGSATSAAKYRFCR